MILRFEVNTYNIQKGKSDTLVGYVEARSIEEAARRVEEMYVGEDYIEKVTFSFYEGSKSGMIFLEDLPEGRKE